MSEPSVTVNIDERGVAKFKWPERVEARDTLPLTNIQKVDKKTLRARQSAGDLEVVVEEQETTRSIEVFVAEHRNHDSPIGEAMNRVRSG